MNSDKFTSKFTRLKEYYIIKSFPVICKMSTELQKWPINPYQVSHNKLDENSHRFLTFTFVKQSNPLFDKWEKCFKFEIVEKTQLFQFYDNFQPKLVVRR